MAKHFNNIKLERCVPNNWLRMHGIPVKRKRILRKLRVSRTKSKPLGEVLYALNEWPRLDAMDEAQREMRIINGLAAEEERKYSVKEQRKQFLESMFARNRKYTMVSQTLYPDFGNFLPSVVKTNL